MTQTLGIGVIGMGWMGRVHSLAYQQVLSRFPNSGVRPRLVMCADTVEARALTAQEHFSFDHYTIDWREVIQASEVDVVNITSPNNTHLEIVEAAARAGKHILCEKPVGRNPQETTRIEAVARKAGVTTAVGYNYRWAPLVQYTRQLIQDNQLGKITHYRGRFFTGYGSSPQGVLSWRFDRDAAGLGTLGDLMSHVIDMAHMIAGPIDEVISNQHTFITQRPMTDMSEGTHFSIGSDGPLESVTNEDYVGALAEFANGARGTLEACRVINGPKCEMAFEVNGTRGAVRWNFERMNELHLYLPDDTMKHEGYTRILSGPEHPFHASFNPGTGVGLSFEDLKVIEVFRFLSAIRDGQRGEPGFGDALAVSNVQSAMQQSWETRNWSRVDYTSEAKRRV